jgi:hypothetical protein
LEDNAQAPDAIYRGRKTGTIGDAGVFSFNRHKTMQCGEGGVVVTNDDRIAKKAALFRNHGETVVEAWGETDLVNTLGVNYRMGEMEAAVAGVQFSRLTELNALRMALCDRLTRNLADIPGITAPKIGDGCSHVYYFYVMKYDKPGKLLKAFGGPETMNTPHGACIDTRNPSFPELVVAVRGKKELHRFSLDGELLGIIEMPGAEVCTAFVSGQEMYVPNLNGYISILDKDNKVISNPGGTAPDYTESGRLRPMEKADDTFIHPHSIMVDDEGDVYVPQWNSGNTYPIKLARVRES